MSDCYPVEVEVGGATAFFGRPDVGSAMISFPAPTQPACKGIFDSIARVPGATIVPVKTEICAPLRWHTWATNYGGPYRKYEQIRDGNSYQMFATALTNVRYRIYGLVELVPGHPPSKINLRHQLQEIFRRRVKRGQCFYYPCLGWREFVVSYFGPCGSEDIVQRSINQELLAVPFLTYTADGQPVRTFRNLKKNKGVLIYV